MRLLIRSDVHLMMDGGNAQPDDKYVSSRLRETCESVDAMFEAATGYKVEYGIDAGDVFHAKGAIPIPVLNAFRRHLVDRNPLDADNYTLSNHGAYGKVTNFTYMDHAIYTFNTGEDVCEGVVTGNMVFNGTGVFTIPYYPDGTHFKELRAHCQRVNAEYEATKDVMDHTIVVMHQGLKEAKFPLAPYGGIETTLTKKIVQKWFPWADLIVMGHYHNPQFFKDDKILIPGALTHQNFGDRGQRRGFWIYDTELGQCIFKDSIAPKFHKVDHEAVDEYEGVLEDGDYLRIVVPSNKSSLIKKLRKRFSSVHLSFIGDADQKEEEVLRDASMTFDANPVDLVEKYASHQKYDEFPASIVRKHAERVVSETDG